MRILMIEENGTNQTLFNLLSFEFEILTTDNQQEAIQLIQQEVDIELIVLNLNKTIKEVASFLSEIEDNQLVEELGIIVLTDPDTSTNKAYKNHITYFYSFKGSFNSDEFNHHIRFHHQLQKYRHQSNTISLEENALFKSIFQQVPIGVSVGYFSRPFYDWEDSFIGINKAFEEITGRSKEELIRLGWEQITHPDDIQENKRLYQQFYEGEITEFSLIKRYIKPDNQIVWVDLRVMPLEFSSSVSTYMCLVEDVTKREEVLEALEESERSQSVLLSNLPGMAYRCLVDPRWTMQFVSLGSLELTGYSPESFINNKEISFTDIIVESYRDQLWDTWQQQMHDHHRIKSEYEIITADGTRKWVSEIGQPIYNEHNEVVAIEGIIVDITENKNHLLQLQYMSEHNMLTGLFNRLYLESMLMKDYSNATKKNALLILNFKKINIIRLAYGYSFGERIIQSVSEGLLKLEDKNHQLFYVSFERLAFYVSDYQDKNDLDAFSDRILQQLIQLELMRTIGCYVGIFEIHKFESRADMIIRNASIAAESQDNHEMFGWNFYDDSLDKKIKRESEIKEELTQEVLRPKRLSCHYQPIMDIKNNKIYAYEALARFESDNLGNIKPIEFIPIAEETQLIIPLGKCILEMSCDFINEVHKLGYKDIKISVNVSTVQLLSNHFVEDVLNILQRKKINPKFVDLEITESVFEDNFEYINLVLDRLRTQGIKISIDDFGTGYSSLARERELNVDNLKIDRFFIDKLMYLKFEEAITGDIISMAHKLGHVVVAEGVEQELQKNYLIQHGCDLIQGYYYSKPMDSKSVLNTLGQHV